MSDELRKITSWEELKDFKSNLMQQFYSFKKQKPDHMLLFQVGQFYETYCEDAVILHNKLDDKLTGKTIEKSRIPMSGVPLHAGEDRANRLAKMGFTVMFVGEKKDENDNITREIIDYKTPATITDSEFLEKDEHQYIMTAYDFKDELGVVIFDTLSGEIFTRNVHKYCIFDLISRYQPKEVHLYLPRKWQSEIMEKLHNIPEVITYDVPLFYKEMQPTIQEHKEQYFAEQFIPYSIIAAHYFMITYLSDIQKNQVTIRPIQYIEERDYLYLHSTAVTGLDLLENSQTKEKKGSLFALLDNCSTPKGSRLLKKWIQEPLTEERKIYARYQGVEFFMKDTTLRSELTEILSETGDIERNLGRLEKGRFKDHELVIILEGLEKYKSFLERLQKEVDVSWIQKNNDNILLETDKIIEELQSKISYTEIVAEGYNEEFDLVRNSKNQGMNWIDEYHQSEQEQTGIKNLKLEQNKVIGYYFEVTKSNLDLVPEHFEYKQTVSGKKRYYTDKLKELEQGYLEAVEQYDSLYRKVIKNIAIDILKHQDFLRTLIDYIALLDILISFAEVSTKYRYRKPILIQNNDIHIEDGKHPLLQAFNYKPVVPNSCRLINQDVQVITGPNMGGKSTYLKMVGLLTIMAQIGCFVPAKFAFKPVDRVLIRMGANDHMLNNQSTFKVEMEEVGYIVYHATPSSLILMDELGRGTSTNDGIRIARSVVKYIHNKIKAKTICSTHYHELIDLEKTLESVKNYHAEAVQTDDNIELTFKIKPGGSSQSFGIQVAKMVGLPEEIIRDAELGL